VEPPLWGDRGRSEEREIARWRCLVREGGVVHMPEKPEKLVFIAFLIPLRGLKILNLVK